LSLLLVAGGLLWLFLARRARDGPPRAESPDPRLAYAGPFRNVRPDVGYVPDARCAECHEKIAAAYAAHPMGRSLFPVDRAPAPPAGARQNNPFEAFGSQFRVEEGGGRARHLRTRRGPDGRPAAGQEWEVSYVIGSGTRGYSYVADWDGYLFQTPISWYAQRQAWGLSPGFSPPVLNGRAIIADCLFCHANRANHVEGLVNRYTRPAFEGHAIGCQRCHGPGELHAAGPGAGADGTDPTIVNPKHLAPNLRSAVCEQCHLQGAARVRARGRGLYDYRPGLPLEWFWSVFVPAPEAGKGPKAIGQVEQMYQSKCFRATAGEKQLGCTSCHDPHAKPAPAAAAAFYRGRCLTCHERRPCGLPEPERRRQHADDSCVACHMPRYGAADIPHTAATDHRVPRNAASKTGAGTDALSRQDQLPLVSFYRGREGVDDAEDDRSRAVALERLALGGDGAADRALRHVLPVLESACGRDPDDFPAGEARGYALALQERPAEALAAFEAVLARAPGRELALVGAATAAESLRRTDAALAYWRRAAVANPWASGYRHSLTLLLVKKGMWDEARPECEAWLRLDPLNAEARAARLTCLLAAGDKAEARAEFARIEALAPPNLPELRIRFEKKLR
jgi:predicted CXXCH cytochrome family protein